MNILYTSNNCIFFTPTSLSFSVSSVVLLSFKYQLLLFFFFEKKKYSSHWNSAKDEALWRLLWKCSANRSDSSSTGLNSPSQSCQNVSSLVSPFSFTYASCARSAGRVACCVVELGSSRENQCVPRFARCVEVCAHPCLVPWLVAEQGARARPNDLLSSLPPPSRSLSISPGLSVSGSADWIQAGALETWSNSHSTLKCFSAPFNWRKLSSRCPGLSQAALGGGGSGGVAARPGRLGINWYVLWRPPLLCGSEH